MFFGLNRGRWLFQSGELRLRRTAFIGMFFNRGRWLFQSGELRLRRTAFIGMFFGLNRRRWLFQSGELRLRRTAFIGMFFGLNRRRWLFQSGELRLRRAAFLGIFFAINRRNMRWVLIEIWSPNPKFFFVRVDPLPQDVTPRASLRTGGTLHTHEIGRKPMAIATAAAPAMV